MMNLSYQEQLNNVYIAAIGCTIIICLYIILSKKLFKANIFELQLQLDQLNEHIRQVGDDYKYLKTAYEEPVENLVSFIGDQRIKEDPVPMHSVYYNSKKVLADEVFPLDRIVPYMEIINNSTALKLELPYNEALEFIIENKLLVNLDDFKLAKEHYKIWCQTSLSL